jgi:hypothetical protein
MANYNKTEIVAIAKKLAERYPAEFAGISFKIDITRAFVMRASQVMGWPLDESKGLPEQKNVIAEQLVRWHKSQGKQLVEADEQEDEFEDESEQMEIENDRPGPSKKMPAVVAPVVPAMSTGSASTAQLFGRMNVRDEPPIAAPVRPRVPTGSTMSGASQRSMSDLVVTNVSAGLNVEDMDAAFEYMDQNGLLSVCADGVVTSKVIASSSAKASQEQKTAKMMLMKAGIKAPYWYVLIHRAISRTPDVPVQVRTLVRGLTMEEFKIKLMAVEKSNNVQKMYSFDDLLS